MLVFVFLAKAFLPNIYLFEHYSQHSLSPSLSLSVSVCVCVSLSLTLSLSICLSVSLSLSLSVSVSVPLSLCASVSVCLSVPLSLSVCLSVCLSVSLSGRGSGWVWEGEGGAEGQDCGVNIPFRTVGNAGYKAGFPCCPHHEIFTMPSASVTLHSTT